MTSGISPAGTAPAGSVTAGHEDAASSTLPDPDAAPVRLPSGGPSMTDAQINRLFAVTWAADKDATIAYPENADNTELKTTPSNFAVALSYQGVFKEAGFLAKSKMLREPKMFEIDYASPDASNIIRIPDDSRFALNVGPCWIVFRERQLSR